MQRPEQVPFGSEVYSSTGDNVVFIAQCPKPYSQRVQSTYMVQSRVSVVVISLMVWVSIPHMGT